MSFVHLHCHTEGSLLDGMCRSRDLARRAAEYGMPAVAVTDHGVMYNVVQFYENCTQAGVKPIIGCEVYVAPGSRFEKPRQKEDRYNHLLLLATSDTGYRNLVKLVSLGYLEGYYYKPRVDRELLDRHREGLIATSACLMGDVCQSVLRGELREARRRAAAMKEIFGPESFFIELQDHGLSEQAATNPELVRIARELGLPLVCTNDVHYLRQEDADPHEVLLCIQTGVTMNNPKRLKYGPPSFYLRTPEEMAAGFREWPEALENTLRIAERCNFAFDFSKTHLPHCEVPAGHTHESWLEHLCREAIPNHYAAHTEQLEARLRYELDVIQSKGYSAYFLIVHDFVRFARERGIMSQARGSAAGSLVSYLLGLTVIDPLRYNLLFERFLNRERKSMPDIDLDFADDRRDEVIQYCRDRYGEDHVAQIIAFGTMAAKAAVRDAGRALEYPLPEVDRVAKLIPTVPGTRLEETLGTVPELRALYDGDERTKRLIDTARSVEGLYRHASIHAAGVVITREPVVEYAPVQKLGDTLAIQYEWADAERIGLLKMDFLGLRNLTVVDRCLKLLRETRGIELDLKQVPFDDPGTFRLLQAGDSIGVFQFESGGMQKLLRSLKPDRLEDLIALVALYRPGPLQSGMDVQYVRRKHGQEPIAYLHPLLEPILASSYGIILYQEQVMQITMALAGFSAGQAEAAMKAMSKKNATAMEELRPAFLAGAEARGVERAVAEQIYEVMYNFASYGFNLNHSAAYAVLSYQTAYLKANYPHEFMATNLSSIVDKRDKLALYVADVRRMGIELLPPCVNQGAADFSVEPSAGSTGAGGTGARFAAAIRIGLHAVKNVGHPCVEAILRARREGGPFTDLADFCRRVFVAAESQAVTRTAVECLIRSGALTCLGGNRAQLLAALDGALAGASSIRRARAQGQSSLFTEGDAAGASAPLTLPALPELSRAELRSLERDLLGVYVTDHPLREVAGALRAAVTAFAADLPEKQDREPVTVGGIIAQVTVRMTRRGEAMANVTLEDETGSLTAVFFPKAYERCRELLEADRIVVIKGRASVRDRVVEDEDTPAQVEVQAEELSPLESRAVRRPTNVHLRLRAARRGELLVLQRLFANNPGDSRLLIHVDHGEREETVLSRLRVGISAQLISEAQALANRVGGQVWVD